jgi:competence protein ComEC
MKRIENILAFSVFIIFGVLGVFLTGEVSQAPYDSENLEVHFLNVGQGDAVLIEQQNEQLLIDGGPDNTILGELGRVMPMTDKKIEKIILTHPHADHLRGLNAVLDVYEVGLLYFNGVSYDTPEFRQFMETIQARNIPTERIYIGKTISINDLTLKTLWPEEKLMATNDANETSLILEGVYGPSRLLFLGDASIEIQAAISSQLSPIDVLKVSHHGSTTATSAAILAIIKPKYSVITVGNNSYGHPSPKVLEMLTGSRVLRTDRDGTISFWADESGIFLY